jgi:hypothetical protein
VEGAMRALLCMTERRYVDARAWLDREIVLEAFGHFLRVGVRRQCVVCKSDGWLRQVEELRHVARSRDGVAGRSPG